MFGASRTFMGKIIYMKKPVKYALIFAAVLLAVWIWRLLNAANRISYEPISVGYIGQGGFLNMSPILSIDMQFNNPTGTAITVNHVAFDVNAQAKDGSFFYIGKINEDTSFRVAANGSTIVKFKFTVDTIGLAKFLAVAVKDGNFVMPKIQFKGYVTSGIAKPRINYIYG